MNVLFEILCTQGCKTEKAELERIRCSLQVELTTYGDTVRHMQILDNRSIIYGFTNWLS